MPNNANPKKNKKKAPLLALAGCIVLLAVLLAVLKLTGAENPEETDAPATVPLFDFAPEDVTAFCYAGNNVEAELIRGSEGNWMLSGDPTLPLKQETVEALAENLLALTAERKLSDSERGEIPPQGENPALRFEVSAGDTTRVLTADALNAVVGIYYVYDETGAVYTVAASDLSALTPTVRSLYSAERLTDKEATEVTLMQVGDLSFTHTDGQWALADDPEFSLDQDLVNRMARTVCEVEPSWRFTVTEDAAADYGAGSYPEEIVALTFADGSSMTVAYGNTVQDAETLRYLTSTTAPGMIFEVTDPKETFIPLKEALAATAETADGSGNANQADIIAENPVGGLNDYADTP